MFSKWPVFALALVASTSVDAATITFDDMVNPEIYAVLPSYSAEGYNFVADRVSPENFMFFGESVREFGWSFDPVGTTLVTNYVRSSFNVSRADQKLFDLVSFQFSDLFNEGVFINDIFVNLFYADGTTTRRLYRTDSLVGPQTLALNARGLTSFTIETPQTAQFDNFILNAADGAPVPEPASWAMMIGGLGLVGGAMRRRGTPRVTFA